MAAAEDTAVGVEDAVTVEYAVGVGDAVAVEDAITLDEDAARAGLSVLGTINVASSNAPAITPTFLPISSSNAPASR
jgi:hypothetical protein